MFQKFPGVGGRSGGGKICGDERICGGGGFVLQAAAFDVEVAAYAAPHHFGRVFLAQWLQSFWSAMMREDCRLLYHTIYIL